MDFSDLLVGVAMAAPTFIGAALLAAMVLLERHVKRQEQPAPPSGLVSRRNRNRRRKGRRCR